MGLIEYAFLGKPDVAMKFEILTSEDVITIHEDQYYIPVLTLDRKGELKDLWTCGDLTPSGQLHETLELLNQCEPDLRWNLALAHVQKLVDDEILFELSVLSGKDQSSFVDSIKGKAFAEKGKILEQEVRTLAAFGANPIWRLQEAFNLVESLYSMEGSFCTLSADTDNVITSYALDNVTPNSEGATLYFVEIHK